MTWELWIMVFIFWAMTIGAIGRGADCIAHALHHLANVIMMRKK